jgi:protein gp37
MSDLFLESVPDAFIEKVFEAMVHADHHIYQVLTKRPKRMVEWVTERFSAMGSRSKTKPAFPSHIWLGVSVESAIYKNRISLLRETPAPTKFISFEPLLGEIDFEVGELEGISWAIIGGESGHRARVMKSEWIESIHHACMESDVAFFFKQWGAFNEAGIKVGKKKSGRLYNGKTWDEMPALTGQK